MLAKKMIFPSQSSLYGFQCIPSLQVGQLGTRKQFININLQAILACRVEVLFTVSNFKPGHIVTRDKLCG